MPRAEPSRAEPEPAEPEPAVSAPAELAPGVHAIRSLDDFAPLRSIVGDARVVALGESVHTVGSYYEAKAAMFRWLVERMGFRVFAWETAWHDARRVDAYVQTCTGDLRGAMVDGLYQVWLDESVVDLFEWMCAWNREHPDDRVHFSGWDSQNPWADARSLREAIAREGGDARLAEGLATCRGADATDRDAFFEAYRAAGSPAIPQADHAACMAGLAAIERWVAEAPFDADRRVWSEVALWSLRGWQENQFLMQSDRAAGFVARDRANFEIFQRMRKLAFDGLKIVVWAHNTHIRKVLPDGGDSNLGVPTGARLHGALGDDYVAIALVARDVDINWTGASEPPVADSPDEVEYVLAERFAGPLLLVDLAATDVLTPGARYWLGGYPGVPAEQFDALLHLDHARAGSFTRPER